MTKLEQELQEMNAAIHKAFTNLALACNATLRQIARALAEAGLEPHIRLVEDPWAEFARVRALAWRRAPWLTGRRPPRRRRRR